MAKKRFRRPEQLPTIKDLVDVVYKTKWGRLKINGTITRECDYCREKTKCYNGEIVGLSKVFTYCKDCMKLMYGIDVTFKRRNRK